MNVEIRNEAAQNGGWECVRGDSESVDVFTAKTKCRKFETDIPRNGISGSQSQFPHSCVCERIMYIPTMGLPFLLEEICRPILGIYKSLTQTHECRNWGWGRAIPRKGNIYVIGIAVAVFNREGALYSNCVSTDASHPPKVESINTT